MRRFLLLPSRLYSHVTLIEYDLSITVFYAKKEESQLVDEVRPFHDTPQRSDKPTQTTRAPAVSSRIYL